MKTKILFLAPVIALTLSGCSLHGKSYEVKDYRSWMDDYHDNYRVLQLTDVHLGDKDNQDLHYKFLDKLITEQKDKGVDFLVITGDLFTFASKGTAKRFFNTIESYKIPWTVTFGNHDEQCYFSIDWMSDYLNGLRKKEGSYCKFKDWKDDNIPGNCNHYIDLMKDGKVFEQLIFLDTERYNFNPKDLYYDYVKDEQIQWYRGVVNEALYDTEIGNAESRSIMFYHIPLPEINDALKTVKSDLKPQQEAIFVEKEGADNHDNNMYYREATCPPNTNSGLFTAMHEDALLVGGKPHTTDMLFGHDHRNNFRITYQDVTFAYGLKATNRIYYDDDMLGSQVITIHNDHSVSYEQFYHTYAEVK